MDKFRINEIIINKLFGVYDYCISLDDISNDKFLILYGDNGTGKSTILRLIYYLLSSKRRSGHKSEIANIPFVEVRIVFANGDFIAATRSNSLIGDYNLEYHGNEVVSARIQCIYSTETGRYRSPANSNDHKLDDILSRFKDLNILFISDKRKELDTLDNGREDDIPTLRMPNRQQNTEEAIEEELKKLHSWVINQALSSTKKGEEGVSSLYEKMLAQLRKKTTAKSRDVSLDGIKEALEMLNKKAQRYAAMGFISEPDYDKVLSRVDGVPVENVALVYSILSPYLEMQKQKIDALDSLVEIISHFTESLNTYLYRKEVEYSVQEGFSIKHRGTDMEICPRDLSSGEKQLILLFSKVIRNNDICSMIIVDEPEISLNIKWQRMLLDSLNYFSRNGAIHFIIATHSIELLSKHMDNIVKLESKNNG